MSTLIVPPAPASCHTVEQISQFLEYLKIPAQLRHAAPSLSLLRRLHTRMLTACPYENLSIHYNPSHTINLDPQFVFQKVVVDARGRGGYCMELAILYNHLLRGLGFNAYTVGVRTRSRIDGVPGGTFPGWVHIVNIVTLPTGERYAVDVAFGGDGPTAPLPLVSGLIHQNLGTQQVRLIRDWVSTQIHRVDDSKLWIYQYRNGADREWNSYYAFTEAEFMAADWGVINYWTSTSSDSHQTRTLLIVRFLGRTPEAGERAEEDDWEIYGKRMLVNGAIKENLGGKTRVLAECNTEAERVEALKQHFGITLEEEEISSIKGWVTNLDSVL
ncbi:hypothetical protein SCARD494_09478 [Seiridium cardinale]